VSAALIWCLFASEEAAAAAAGQLLDEGLVACVNILPEMRSLYVWQGQRDEARECGALFKTEARLLERAVARLAAIHPYETPAIAGWLADATAPATAAWMEELV
jgi:periplasmic divalent cation tolerance protein